MTEPGEPIEERDEEDLGETEGPINPDPPHSAGTPEPPNLDVDPEQFIDEDEKRGRADEPPS
ncbi:hypothetical protein [Saccharothrix sp. ALI-22-I]|uniref:hypothetical protein n=1 Tax=Saccharothrix sp. ALI-22-I TaxID=1933778 RepID=UPI00117BAC8A|nr:hypothetical protein [Saccharothrix sp. ALI-22-I]